VVAEKDGGRRRAAIGQTDKEGRDSKGRVSPTKKFAKGSIRIASWPAAETGRRSPEKMLKARGENPR